MHPIHGRVVLSRRFAGLTVQEYSNEPFAPWSGRRDSIIIKAVSQSLGSSEVAPAPAVAAVDALPVVDLVINFDIELVTGEFAVVVKFSC